MTPIERFQALFQPFDASVKKTKKKGGRSDITFVEWTQYIVRAWREFTGGFSTEIRSIVAIGEQLILVVRVTDFETGLWQEGTGSAQASKDKDNWGGATAEAESQALRRAFAKFGLGLEMYFDDDEFNGVIAGFYPDTPATDAPAPDEAGEPEEAVEATYDMTDEQSERLGQYAQLLTEWAEEEKIGGDGGAAEETIDEVLGLARAKLAAATDQKKVAGVVIRGLKRAIDERGIAVPEDPQ